ncbi:MAG: LD-carboxypeptidase [Allomuricauda sp.]
MLNRRSFINLAALFSATSALPHFNSFKTPIKVRPQARILPKRLKKGDTIGLIAPGYAVKPEVVQKTIQILRKMGFKTYHSERLLNNHGYFSNTDIERAKDVNEMFSDPKINGILCARGGYGCTRILSLLDYENIKNNPKALIGFSDVTALINAIYKETGLVGYHGPVGSTLDDSYSLKYLKKVVMRAKNTLTIKNVVLKEQEFLTNTVLERYTITNGIAQGELVGGSLTLVNALIGTPHEIDFTNKIAFIEDVEEAPYRIDRMLTQLLEGPTFSKARAIMFGVCEGCDRPKEKGNFTLKEVLMDRIAPLGIPAAYGMSFGHIPNNFTVPVGINASFDADKKTLELLEPAVS